MRINNLGAIILLAFACPAMASQPLPQPMDVLLLPFADRKSVV